MGIPGKVDTGTDKEKYYKKNDHPQCDQYTSVTGCCSPVRSYLHQINLQKNIEFIRSDKNNSGILKPTEE